MKIPAVILAAGASRRLGEPKQLVRLNGETLIHRMARTALECCHPVVVILGSGWEKIRAELSDLDVCCVRNLDWEEGMASSLRTAVTAIPLEAQAALFLVCDQPAVDHALLTSMMALHHGHPWRRIACGYAGTRGIPAILPRADFDALLELRGDRGAKPLLQAEGVLEVGFPAGDLDLDRPEDLARLSFGLPTQG
jgi:molybdenum cofactor cytidylyltransferase